MTHAEKSDPIERAERKGRGGDRLLGHLTPGDVVIPRGRVTPELRELLAKHFDIDCYTAGHARNSINPRTGLPEFADGLGGDGGAGSGGFDGAGGYGAGDTSNAPGSLGAGIEGLMGMVEALDKNDPGAFADAAGVGGGAGQAPSSGGWLDAIKGFFASGVGPAPVGDGYFGNVNSAQGDFANGALQDSTQPPWIRADYVPTAQPVAPQVVTPNNVSPLGAPQAPALPTTMPEVGRYYGALLNEDMNLANNLLGPYLSGNKNVYGR